MTTPVLSARELDELQEHRDRLAMRLNKVINHLAGRDDLLLECIWSRSGDQPDAPAWFTPSTGWVTIDATFALQGTHPSRVNPLTVQGRREHPVIVGLCCHEASHAHSTRWPTDVKDLSVPAGVMKAAVLLEEPRIEARQIERRPSDRPYLRAQSILIDLKQFRDATEDEPVALDRWRAANAALMTLARVDAGVLEESDAEIAEPILRERLGDDLDALQEVWREAIALEDGDFDGLIEVGRKWVAILGEPPEIGLVMPGCAAEATGESVPSDSEWDEEGSPSEVDPETLGELAKALSEMAGQAAAEASEELQADEDAEDASADQDRVKQVEQESRDRKQQKQAQKRGESVFSKEPSPSRVSFREPTPSEQALSRQLGTILKHAKFQERTSTKIRSQVPPGRLDSREAMQGRAQRAMGLPVTVQPYQDKRHKRAPEPPITLGIMADTSGSMGWATSLMATLTWSFAHALTYVRGKAASVLFGDRVVIPLAKPGQPPAQVASFDVRGGDEVFKQAFEALDGALNLTMGKGVRLLVVISDGQYMSDQNRAAQEAVQRMVRNGGIVLWVTENISRSTIPEGAIPIEVDLSGRPVDGLPRGADTVPSAMVLALAVALNS